MDLALLSYLAIKIKKKLVTLAGAALVRKNKISAYSARAEKYNII
jgi:hypothetical protein